MTNWTVSAYTDRFSIETPTGERIAHVDPYERGGYLVPLDHVRGVALRDLVRALRSEHACDKMMISRQREQWFDLDTASPDFALAPGEPRRFEVEFIFDQAADIADEDNDAEGRRLAALLTPLVQGNRGKVASVELHPNAYEPPWPYVIVLSLPLNGWTVQGVARLVENAIDLLQAIGAGKFSRSIGLQVLRSNNPEALLGQHESIYLDVKQSHYNLDTAQGEIALSQAVARFANAEQGGLLVIGMRGKKIPGGEVVSKLTPVPVSRRDVRRYRLAIERRLFPLVDGLEVFTIETSEDAKVLVLHIPPQAEELKPFLVHGAIVGDKIEGAFVSIVRRREEYSVPITAPAIHAMLAAGRALLRRGELPDSEQQDNHDPKRE
jgi:hypothetical protein